MKKQILVLDDSPFMLNVFRDALSSLNYAVTTVDNSREALRKVTENRYDLIITDMNMPDIDGIEFAKQVRTYPDCRFLPIVMVSGEKNEAKIALAKKVGVSTFLSKPLKEAQLKTMLHITLNDRTSTRLPVKVEISYGDHQTFSSFTSAYTFNLSLGGVFIETEHPLPPGETLNLKLSFQGSPFPIVGKGRVAWVNSAQSLCQNDHPPGMGVEFLTLDNEQQLQNFLQSGVWKR